MRTSSRKAKGRRLQNTVRDVILDFFPELTEDDVRVAIMGETGADIKFSKKAKDVVGLAIECKNQEGFKKLYDFYDQAEGHEWTTNDPDDIVIPTLVLKSNRKEPLVILHLLDFMGILQDARRNESEEPRAAS